MDKKVVFHFLYYWFPVLFYCLAIFVQSSFSTLKQIPDLPQGDKVLHFVGYAILGVLFLRGFKNSKLKNRGRLIMVASIVLTAIYGATDELHQYYVPNRSAEIGDIFFDFCGGLFGVYIYQLFLEKYPRIGSI